MSLGRYMLAGFVALLLSFPTFSSAHLKTEILYCPQFAEMGPTHTPKFLSSHNTGQGLIVELYDVNNDGRADVAVYSARSDGETDGQAYHKDAPIFYELDIDGDGEPDELWIDSRGQEKCGDLVIYSEDNAGGLM